MNWDMLYNLYHCIYYLKWEPTVFGTQWILQYDNVITNYTYQKSKFLMLTQNSKILEY